MRRAEVPDFVNKDTLLNRGGNLSIPPPPRRSIGGLTMGRREKWLTKWFGGLGWDGENSSL